MAENLYRDILHSVNEGFCIIDIIYDDDGKPVDWLFLETNPAFLEQVDLPDAAGHRCSELLGTPDAAWLDFYHNVALTGTPAHMAKLNTKQGRWYDAYACKVGGADSKKVAVLFRDVTEQKNTEIEKERYINIAEEKSAWLQSIIQLLPGGVWISDHTGKVVMVNHTAQNMYRGCTPLAGSPNEYSSYKLFLPGTNEPVVFGPQSMKEALKDVVLDFERSDGTRGTQVASTDALRDKEGNIISYVAVATEITTLRLQSEDRYRALFENSAYAFALIEPLFDENRRLNDFRYLQINPAFELMSGFKVENFLGKKLSEVLPRAEPYWLEMFGKVITSGKTERFEGYNNDSARWYEVIIFNFAEGLLGQQFMDITERKRNEDALLESEGQLRDILEQLPVGVAVFDCDGNTKISNEQMGSYVTAQIPSLDPERKMHWRAVDNNGEDIPPDHWPGARALRGEKVLPGMELTYIDPSGEIHWLSVSASPLRSRTGDIIGGTSVANDITERKRNEEALRESEQKAKALVAELKAADKNKDQFISVLSHELRNPLAVIMAALSLMEIMDDQEHAAVCKETIKRQTEQITKLVDDLMDLIRINKNKIKLKKENVNLNTLLRYALLDNMPRYTAKGVQLQERLPKTPVFLNADPVRLTQCVDNLLQNALRYTPETGTVTLSLETENGEVVIGLQDNGIGITEEFLKRIFVPFTQADESLDRPTGSGLGLGLSIVKGIVTQHGGSVTASSEGVGKGSSFTIRLPILPQDTKAQNPDPSKKNGRHHRILLIEDNRDLSDLLCAMLRIMGHQVSAAFSGQEGVLEAVKMRPDVIICDIGLPGLNGYEVAKVLKANADMKDAVLIALTGYIGDLDIERARLNGFDQHLKKPVNMEALERTLAAV